MPCSDGGFGRYEDEQNRIKAEAKLKQSLKEREAMLCAVLRTLTPTGYKRMLSNFDEREAGVTKDRLMEWWEDHQEEDARRIEAEKEKRRAEEARLAEKKRKDALRETAMKKLTKEERSALGFA